MNSTEKCIVVKRRNIDTTECEVRKEAESKENNAKLMYDFHITDLKENTCRRKLSKPKLST